MSEDLTKSVTIQRNTKKKSGYSVSENDDAYYLETTPARARANPGDRVVRINGVPADEFHDEEYANDLIESIRIVVVPKDKLDEYDEEEGCKEADRSRGNMNNVSLMSPATVSNLARIYHCDHCGFDNEDLSLDEDGDYVCEECGHVIDSVSPFENNEADCDDRNPKMSTYVCPECKHENINPQPDDEGDRVCEECGCILPEKKTYECDVCKHETIDPKLNKRGDFVCENCGSALDVDEDYRRSAAQQLNELQDDDSDGPGGGQRFDENGMPITNAKGKKLTPADMFEPGDVITVSVTKSNAKQDAGMKIEERNGKYYVCKVPSGGHFSKTPVIAGDKILELNGIDSHDFKDVNELKKILKSEKKISVVVERKDPDASESSASSIDYEGLRAIEVNSTPADDIKGSVDDEMEDAIDDETDDKIDDDTDDDESRGSKPNAKPEDDSVASSVDHDGMRAVKLNTADDVKNGNYDDLDDGIDDYVDFDDLDDEQMRALESKPETVGDDEQNEVGGGNKYDSETDTDSDDDGNKNNNNISRAVRPNPALAAYDSGKDNGDNDTRETVDDDTASYNGEDCGVSWCPHCRPYS